MFFSLSLDKDRYGRKYIWVINTFSLHVFIVSIILIFLSLNHGLTNYDIHCVFVLKILIPLLNNLSNIGDFLFCYFSSKITSNDRSCTVCLKKTISWNKFPMSTMPANLEFCGRSWSWLYGNWIYNYLCNQCLSPLMLWVRISIRTRWTRYSIMW